MQAGGWRFIPKNRSQPEKEDMITQLEHLGELSAQGMLADEEFAS